jgi:prevent-host-death family protein
MADTESITIRELRNHGGDVLNRVIRGETLIVTRDGAEVAELRPLRRARVSSAELIARRASLPLLDVERLRADIDAIVDPRL